MDECTVRFSESDVITVKTPEELDKALDRLHNKFLKERPTLVEVARKSGDSLAIGLGYKTKSILSFVSSTGDPPYYVSVGSKSKKNQTKTVVFYWYDEWSEFPQSYLIPYEEAKKTVKEFALTGALAKHIEWEEG